MRIDTLIALTLGILIEVLSLWEIARREQGRTVQLPYLPPWLTPERVVMLGLAVFALLAMGLFRLGGIQDLDAETADAWMMAVMVPAGVFAFGFGLLHPVLLPRVNERMLFTVLVTSSVGMLLSGEFLLDETWVLGGVIVLNALLFWASVSGRRLPSGLQMLVYFGYLSGLFWMSYGQMSTFATAPSSTLMPLDAFLLGIVGLFYALHVLFWVRFFLIMSSMLLPNHWQYLPDIMDRLFSNSRNTPKEVGISLGIALGFLALNQLTGTLPASLFASVLVPVLVQELNLRQRLG
ncbi:MAG: hypothetical protein ACP5HM_15840 [Anaerolineae bacterium]